MRKKTNYKEEQLSYSLTYEEAVRVFGYPILFKAVSGVSKGMKIVYKADKLEEAFDRKKREVEAIFGNGGPYVERYIKNTRHVEVQVLFDEYGNEAHLGERDCSIQRRAPKAYRRGPPALFLVRP